MKMNTHFRGEGLGVKEKVRKVMGGRNKPNREQ